MLYFCILIIYVILVNQIPNYLEDKKNAKKVACFLTCGGIVCFQGFRSFEVGTDLKVYIPAYNDIGLAPFLDFSYQNFEPGYMLLNKVLYLFNVDNRGFLIIITMIIQIPIICTIYKHSKLPLMSVLYYFSFGNFIVTFSGLRQSIAMALCFCAYNLIKEKKIIYYCSVVALATMFHTSALFCLIIYPLYYCNLGKKHVAVLAGMVFTCFIFRKKILLVLSYLYYGEELVFTETRAYTMFIIYAVIFLLAFSFDSEDKDFKGLRNILWVLTLIYVFASIHNYATRIGYSLCLYMTLLIPLIIEKITVTPKSVYYMFCYIFLIVSCFYFVGAYDTLPFSFG